MKASHLEVLVEEKSMERVLHLLLPKIIGDLGYRIITSNGKDDLLQKLPLVLKGYSRWFAGGERVLVIVDRDDHDCHTLKRRLESFAENVGLPLCHVAAGQPGWVLNRIAVEELEAWFIGDVAALRKAYARVPESLDSRKRFRDPDGISGTWEALEKVLKDARYHKGGLQKITLAEAVAPHLDLDNNRSPSFRAFVSGVRYLVEGAA